MCTDVVIGKTSAYWRLQQTKEYTKADYSLRAKSQTSSLVEIVPAITGGLGLKVPSTATVQNPETISWTQVIGPRLR